VRVALISDLHGNEVALRAVLDDIARVGVDQLACLGDVATLGPRPEAILAILRDLGCPCILGNHDAFLLDAQLIRTYSEIPMIVDSVTWCRDRLSAQDLDFVRGFVAGTTIDLGGGATLRLYHGTPRSHMEDLLATTPSDEVDRMLDGATGTILAGGHTHVQMVRQHRGMWIVNPGSVGLPFREYVGGGPPTLLPWAEYAIVDARGTTLRRVDVDRAKVRADVSASELPMRGALLGQL
jgi:predicted phosphodiesterase